MVSIGEGESSHGQPYRMCFERALKGVYKFARDAYISRSRLFTIQLRLMCDFVPVTSRFLSRVSILLLTRDIDILILSVRPSFRLSVCLSVRDTLVLYENGLTYRHSYFTIR